MASHPSFLTHAAARRTAILTLAMVLAGLLLCDALVAQTVTPVPIEGSDQLPFAGGYQALFGNRDVAVRLNYDTERYGQENGQFGIGLQGHRPFDGGVWLFSGQYDLDFGRTDRMGLNVGGGVRMFYPSLIGGGETRILGAQLWYDGLETEIDNYFNQIGFSLESLGDNWDFRINGNFPIGTQTQAGQPVRLWEPDGNPTLGYYGEFLSQLTDIPIDEAISVVDFEVARRVSKWDAWLFAGGYGLDASGDTCFGAKVGARGWLGSDAMMQLALTQDDFFDTRVTFSVVWYPGRNGLFGHRTRCLDDRLRDPVIRNDYIATRRLHDEGGIALHDIDGNPIRVVHVNSAATAPGDGTYEDPYTSLASVYPGSQVDDIILVWSDSTYTGETIQLRDRQRLLGEGTYTFDGTQVTKRHEVVTEEFGNIDLPATRPGALAGAIPVINNTMGDVVTLATGSATVNTQAKDYDPNQKISYNEVSNLSIDGGARAIVSPTAGTGEVDINNMTIANTTGNGVELKPFVLKSVNNVGTELSRRILFTNSVTKTQFDNVGTSGTGDDISLDATTTEAEATPRTESITVEDVLSTAAWGWGINVVGNRNTAAINEYKFIAGTQSDGGIQFTSSQGGATVSNSDIEGTTVAASTGIGVNLVAEVGDSFNSNFTFNNVTITDMGTAGFQVSGGDTDVTFTGLITQGRDAPAVHVIPTQSGVLYSYHTGTLNFNEIAGDVGVVQATAGTGLVFEDANGIYNFNHWVNLVDVSTGIDISNTEPTAGGLFTFSSVSIDNPTDAGVRVDGGVPTVNFTGLITHNSATGTGYAVDILGGHNGTVTFNEKDADKGVIDATYGTGVRFTNADGTYRFNKLVSIADDATAGISIIADGSGEGSDGSFTFSNVAIDDIDGVGFNLNNGTAGVSFTGIITQNTNTTAAAVTIGGGHREGTLATEGTGIVTFVEKNTGDGVVVATEGAGIQFNNADGTYNFNSKIDLSNSVGTGGSGIGITNGSDGIFTFSSISMTDIDGVGFNLNGGTAAVNFTGKITQTANDREIVTIGGGHHEGTGTGEGSGVVTFSESSTGTGIVTATEGDGLQFDNADGTYLFNNLIDIHRQSVAVNPDAGINITGGSDGTFTFSNVAMTDINGIGFRLNGGTAGVTLAGNITQSQYDSAAVHILGGHREGTATGEGTGIVTFSEKTAGAGIVTASTGDGLQFENADGTYVFSNKIDLSGTVGATAGSGIGIDEDGSANGSDGTFTFSNVAVNNISGAGFSLNGGTAQVTFTGKITQTADNFTAISVTGEHAAGTGTDQGNGTVVFNEKTGGAGVVEATTGTGLQFNEANGTYTFSKLVKLGTAVATTTARIGIVDSDGTFNLNNVEIYNATTTATNPAFQVDGGKANVTFTGMITESLAGVTSPAVEIKGGHTGTINFNEKTAGDGVIVASTGTGLVFNEADGTYNFNDKVTLSGTAHVAITNSDGTISFFDADSDINNSSAASAFSVNGGKGTVVYAGDITSSGSTRPVVIQNVTGGTVTFSGSINSTGGGILVGDDVLTPLVGEGNTGGTFNFNGPVVLNVTGSTNAIDLIDNRAVGGATSATTTFSNLQITTEDGTGLNATSGFNSVGSGIVQVTGSSNTIDTTSGTGVAINMDHAQVGSSGVRFASVSVDGAANGMVFNDVVGSGTVTISDGTIQNTTGDGVSITAGNSIYTSVTTNATLSLNSLAISNTGTGGAGDGISLTHSNAKAFNVTLANCSIDTTPNGDGVHLEASGSAAMHLSLSGNTITQSGAGQQAVQFNVNSGAGNTYIVLSGNTLEQTAAAAINQQALLLNVNAGTCYFQAIGSNTFSSSDTTVASYAGAQIGASFDANVTGGALNATIHDNTFNNDSVGATARGFRMAAVGGPVKLSLLDNTASADGGAAPFLLYKNGGSSFGVELLQTPDATAITDKTPEVNIRNGGSGTYADYDVTTYPTHTTPAAAGWVIEFLPDAAPLTPPISLGFGNLAEGAVPTQ